MSQANIELIQECYARFGRGDVTGLIELMSPDVRWEFVGQPGDYPLFGARFGPEGVADFFRTMERSEQITAFEPRDVYAARDKVFVQGHAAYVIKASGKTVASDWAHIFTVRDGLIVEFREFADTASIAAAHKASNDHTPTA